MDVVSCPRQRCASAMSATAALMHSSQIASGRTAGLACVAVQVRRSDRKLARDAIAVRPSYAVETTRPGGKSYLSITLAKRRGARILDLRALAATARVVGRPRILRLQPVVRGLPVCLRHTRGAGAISHYSRHDRSFQTPRTRKRTTALAATSFVTSAPVALT